MPIWAIQLRRCAICSNDIAAECYRRCTLRAGAMGIKIWAKNGPSGPDQAIVPDPQPKLVPGAQDAVDNNWPSSNDDGKPGKAGTAGLPGLSADNGNNGASTPTDLNFIIQDFVGVFDVSIRGGDGGGGGRGGRGGQGGEGQDGGNGDDVAGHGPGGPGGAGGTGGNGGNGGSGGSANNVNLYIPDPNDVISADVDLEFSFGLKGLGGNPGLGGAGGLGGRTGGLPDLLFPRGATGVNGATGAKGADGIDGIAGKLNIYIGFMP